MNKAFLITIDTEGDNIWNWKYGNSITTNNAKYLKRFQLLCEKYGFKPVYLTNYEMAKDDCFVQMAKTSLRNGTCEIGMHLHAYNNPPFHELKVSYPQNFPYLIEYPEEIIEKKIEVLTNCLEQTFEIKIRSHRAGRWALNKNYLQLLLNNGYDIDCSVTPGVNWSSTAGTTVGSRGTNYTKFPKRPFYIMEGLMEVPVTIRKIKKAFISSPSSLKDIGRIIKRNIFGQKIWIRPNGKNLEEILTLIRQERLSEYDYLMFMLHSSEMMPGGSPTFPYDRDIEVLFQHMELIFSDVSEFCIGKTLSEYVDGIKHYEKNCNTDLP